MKTLIVIIIAILSSFCYGQNPTPFACTGSDGFGYYTSSATSSTTGNVLIYSSSRISKIVTSTGIRTTLCDEVNIGVALNALAFNPHDNFLYAVTRYDANDYSGKFYRIGGNCQKKEIPISGSFIKFLTNNKNTVDASGGNISSGTFDLDNNYYVNTSFTNTTSSGFTNKLQKISLTGSTATVLNTVTLTCPSCTGTNKLSVTDIIFDELSNSLYGSNTQTNKLYKINSSSGVLTEVGVTGITSRILGMYKNRDGNVRAISETGNIYSVNLTSGIFTLLSTVTTLNSSNADGASGCYAPPKITGHLFLDANGLVDNIVNGIPTNSAAGIILYANLVKGGLIVKSDQIDLATGLYQFLGLFTGLYEIQISTTPGVTGQTPPALNLPTSYTFTGENIGTNAGNDGSPNGKISISVANGVDIQEVNFGINRYPVAADINGGTVSNPGGTNTVIVPTLIFKDEEEPNISNITIKTIPNAITQGTLYYNGIIVTANQLIPNYNPSLLTFDPIDGNVTMTFTYITTDMAGQISNTATVTQSFNIVLPITYAFFKGTYLNETVILNWQTVSEINNSFFLVEKSSNNKSYKTIDKIASKQGFDLPQNYEAQDKSKEGNAYYRLRQVDFDGNFSFSNTIYVEVKKYKAFFIEQKVGSNLINVNFEFENNIVDYKIMNTSGQTVKHGTISENNTSIQIGTFQKGIYYITLIDTNGALIGTTDFIKM